MSNIKDRYSTEMYELEEILNDFNQCNLEIYCDINEIDKGIKYFKDNYISQDEEVKEYVLLEVLDDYNVNLTISEGRYHQVKRMFAALGNKVVALHRWRIGNVELDESLEEGEFRPLTQEEIDNLVK